MLLEQLKKQAFGVWTINLEINHKDYNTGQDHRKQIFLNNVILQFCLFYS